ncbi:MAG: DUF1684 domain-containing protein [Candidatus Acidiferrales bacterium]
MLGSSLAADEAYRASVEKWRRTYEASLKSDDGWLTVAGLFWLHEGENRFGSDPLNDIVLNEAGVPAEVGSFDMHAGKIVVRINPGVQIKLKGNAVEAAAVLPDSDDRLALGALSLLVHRSGERYAVRLKDKNSKLRRGFAGLRWFPIDEAYRVTAKFVAYDKPRAAEIQNDAGDMLKIPAPGYAVFTLAGKEYRLEALDEGGAKLSFIFRDLTSGNETYAASRFLDAPLPKDGQVVLDFNEAYNPPCAYNPYTTCPLPTPENRLRVRIAAGEMMYKGRRGN